MNDLDRFREIMKANKLSWKDVAEITGYTKESLRSMFSGGRSPRWTSLFIHIVDGGRSPAKINSIKDINRSSAEGRLLFAAISMLTSIDGPSDANQIIKKLNEIEDINRNG